MEPRVFFYWNGFNGMGIFCISRTGKGIGSEDSRRPALQTTNGPGHRGGDHTQSEGEFHPHPSGIHKTRVCLMGWFSGIFKHYLFSCCGLSLSRGQLYKPDNENICRVLSPTTTNRAAFGFGISRGQGPDCTFQRVEISYLRKEKTRPGFTERRTAWVGHPHARSCG